MVECFYASAFLFLRFICSSRSAFGPLLNWGRMVVQCPSCLTKFSVDPTAFAKFLNPRFHCTRCGHYFTSAASSVNIESAGSSTSSSGSRSTNLSRERRRTGAAGDEAEQLELLPNVSAKAQQQKKHRRVERSSEHSSPITDDEDISITAQWCDDSGQIQYEADLGQIHPVNAEVVPASEGRNIGAGIAGRISAAAVLGRNLDTRAIDYRALETRDRPRPVDPSYESLRESGIEMFEPQTDGERSDSFSGQTYIVDPEDSESSGQSNSVAEWSTPEFQPQYDSNYGEHISDSAVDPTIAVPFAAVPIMGGPADGGLTSARYEHTAHEAEWSFDSVSGDADAAGSNSAETSPLQIPAGNFSIGGGSAESGTEDESGERGGRYSRSGYSWSTGGTSNSEATVLETFVRAPVGAAAGPGVPAPRFQNSARLAPRFTQINLPQVGPVVTALIRTALITSVPMVVLLLFLKFSGFLGGYGGIGAESNAPLRSLTSIGELRVPRAAPIGMELTDIKPEIVALDNGEEVMQLSGNIVNTTKRKIVEAIIEAKTFSSSVETLERVEVNFSNGLTNAARISALGTPSLLDLQTREGIKEVRLNPNERAPFKLVVPTDAGKAAWYSARISRVRYEDL